MTKNLILMRHGQAFHPQSGQSDDERTLTENGLVQTLKVGERIAELNHSVELAWVSPFVRTQQSFAQVEKGYGVSIKKVDNPQFTPDVFVKKAVSELLTLDDEIQSLIVVTHLPLISDLTYELTKKRLSFSPATAVCLKSDSWDADTWEFSWNFTPF